MQTYANTQNEMKLRCRQYMFPFHQFFILTFQPSFSHTTWHFYLIRSYWEVCDIVFFFKLKGRFTNPNEVHECTVPVGKLAGKKENFELLKVLDGDFSMKIYIVALHIGFEGISALAVMKGAYSWEKLVLLEALWEKFTFMHLFLTLHWRWWHGSLAVLWFSIFSIEEEALWAVPWSSAYNVSVCFKITHFRGFAATLALPSPVPQSAI